jgi:hypothetical protein
MCYDEYSTRNEVPEKKKEEVKKEEPVIVETLINAKK